MATKKQRLLEDAVITALSNYTGNIMPDAATITKVRSCHYISHQPEDEDDGSIENWTQVSYFAYVDLKIISEDNNGYLIKPECKTGVITFNLTHHPNTIEASVAGNILVNSKYR